MSRSRTAERLTRYSLCPERDSRRVTRTSLEAIGSVPSELSNTRETSATFTGRRPVEPWKMTSSILPPRNRRGDCSPSTQRTASEMFDLPHPFGPTMAVTPVSNGNSTAPANDLNPASSSRVNLMVWPHPGDELGANAGTLEARFEHAALLWGLERAHQQAAVAVPRQGGDAARPQLVRGGAAHRVRVGRPQHVALSALGEPAIPQRGPHGDRRVARAIPAREHAIPDGAPPPRTECHWGDERCDALGCEPVGERQRAVEACVGRELHGPGEGIDARLRGGGRS